MARGTERFDAMVNNNKNNFEQTIKGGDIMAYNYAKLNGKITEKCGTQAVFAEKMGLSERTISMKLNNKISFKQPEILKALDILGLSADEIQSYFFTLEVQ